GDRPLQGAGGDHLVHDGALRLGPRARLAGGVDRRTDRRTLRRGRRRRGHQSQGCPVTAQKMFGRAVDLSNLEVVCPVQRVAHPAVDTDGRQVGENNVVDPLFLDLPTERRLCNYAGSRFHNQAPINYTALRGMTKRWPELLSLTEQFRDAFFARMPRIGPAMLAGEVHLLAVTSLASLGYVMVRGIDPVPNGQLDAGLAAMFR